MKLSKENFNIEGWFPPCIVKTISGRYACCGDNWVEIEDNVTINDVMRGWVCTAPAYVPKPVEAKPMKKMIPKKSIPKKLTY